jgi:hypothetical protein
MLAMGVKVGRTMVNPTALTRARPLLTEIVDAARDTGQATALTEYGRARAVVVAVPYYEEAEHNAAIVAALAEADPELHAKLDAAAPKERMPPRFEETTPKRVRQNKP